MVTIRQVIPADAGEIAILSQQLGYAVSGEQTLQNIYLHMQSKSHEAFVAIYEQRVIGWTATCYTFTLTSSPVCEINGLVVHEDFRGQGIGKMLIKNAKEWATEKGVNKLRLRCNINRPEAILFYRKIGFNEVKQQKVFEISLPRNEDFK